MNKIQNQKKIVSDRKFNRLFDNNLDCAGFTYITKNWVTYRSLQSVKIGNYIYAKFPCKNQTADRLSVYCTRYSIREGETLDFIAFSEFPLKVF